MLSFSCAAKPVAQVAAKPAAKPAAGEPIPIAFVEHVQLFKVGVLPPEKVARRACLSVELDMHPNRQFPGHFVVHMPLCLHVWFRDARPLHSNRGARGPSFGVRSLGGGRIPSRTGGYCPKGRGVQYSYILESP